MLSVMLFLCEKKEEMFSILPAESVLDQSCEDVREQCMQWVAAEASLVSVCDAEKSMYL